MKKKLNPSSSHFLSQKFWRIMRKILDRNTWSYLYIISQKMKLPSKLNLIKNNDLNIISNLKYPKIRKVKKSKNKFNNYLVKYKSSKPKGNYRKFLNSFFKKIKTPKTILELGISEAAGLLAMRDYFSNSLLWGVDIDRATFIKGKRIVNCGYCNQLELHSIKKILKKFDTKFDLIVDDGWHHPESQINSILSCLPYLNEGGTYITEDIVHDSYKNYFYRLIELLKNKGFKVNYKTFHISDQKSNLVGTFNNGYLIIYRKSQ
tara:strand:+ start:497 stop:1282 length:786 start_codon:yes stop_codon:yes gene_type:complete